MENYPIRKTKSLKFYSFFLTFQHKFYMVSVILLLSDFTTLEKYFIVEIPFTIWMSTQYPFIFKEHVLFILHKGSF